MFFFIAFPENILPDNMSPTSMYLDLSFYHSNNLLQPTCRLSRAQSDRAKDFESYIAFKQLTNNGNRWKQYHNIKTKSRGKFSTKYSNITVSTVSTKFYWAALQARDPK